MFFRSKRISSNSEPYQSIRVWDHPLDFEEFVVVTNHHQSPTISTDSSSLYSEGAPSSSSKELSTPSYFQPEVPSSSSSIVSSSLRDRIADTGPNSELASQRSRNLLTLPAELIPHIATHLSYPDIVALRHTHPRFLYTSLLSSSKPLKVEWLLARGNAGLPIPRNGKLRLDSDAAFLRNSEVRSIIMARRRHAECGSDQGACTVVTGSTCGGRKVRWKGSFFGVTLVRYEGEERSALAGRLFNAVASGEGLAWEVKWVIMSLGALAVSLWLSVGFALRQDRVAR